MWHIYIIHVYVCVCIYVPFTLFHNWWVLGEANVFQSKVCCVMFSYFLLIVELEVMFDIMMFWPG